ncbi:MAG: thiamine-phosphate kinase [Thermobacillus sp. ZCTH02-B1]|uniref:thiamine-phosphate kinase n=1 Tax=Thermobacillus sp. ZCTH02-B1 TaxID=1858795 RepID=UPI000B576A20|nr:thiamine-phosphate kinase [Thermobacillus sp. ZCTH02-B1]OUM94851.1 MAG: thiamine-phosphate kinase [Thermobacillus sp. ZCTH02-B1]
MDEFARIRLWTGGRQRPEWQRSRGVVVGIGDDAAVLEPDREGAGAPRHLVWTIDTMVEDVHFSTSTMDDADIGWKALASNVSDIAAMGAEPRHALVSVSMPRSRDPERVRRLYDGLYECADRYGVAIVGGDTTASPDRLVVTVALGGSVEAGKAVTRAGARPGDLVFLTGPVGLSAAGLHWLSGAAGNFTGPVPLEAAEAAGTAALVRAHRRPQPSVAAGRLLAASGACTSLNDVSDGLASEAREIAEASGAALVIRERLLPVPGDLAAYARAAAGGDGARAGELLLGWMLGGGEDYVLLGTMDPAAAGRLAAAFREAGLELHVIGEAEAGPAGVWLEPADGGPRRPAGAAGYNHFGVGREEGR